MLLFVDLFGQLAKRLEASHHIQGFPSALWSKAIWTRSNWSLYRAGLTLLEIHWHRWMRFSCKKRWSRNPDFQRQSGYNLFRQCQLATVWLYSCIYLSLLAIDLSMIITHNAPLALQDNQELVFMAAKGLQIGAVQIASVEGILEEERSRRSTDPCCFAVNAFQQIPPQSLFVSAWGPLDKPRSEPSWCSNPWIPRRSRNWRPRMHPMDHRGLWSHGQGGKSQGNRSRSVDKMYLVNVLVEGLLKQN